VSTRIVDSPLYAQLWGTREIRDVLGEDARLQSWLDVLAALARAQADEGVIPADAARTITTCGRLERLDLDYAAAETSRSGHSTLGVIRALQAIVPGQAREHVYIGASVQDITDTATSLALARVGTVVWRDLRRIETLLLDLAARYRDTAMAGRTHGQPAAPVTFGYKAACWAGETRRHLDRLREGRPRWLVAQLAGGAGSLVSYRGRGPAVRARFCAELGLFDPGISWTATRDRVVEFAQVLALVSVTLARIGGEIYELARPEIGELAEPASDAVVSSITMPHKRNPECSEHLDTLARLVRAQTGTLLESAVAIHERDGRAWKAEWVALPEVCLLTTAALGLAVEILDGLEVHTEAMAENLRRDGGYTGSERVLAELTPRWGKHTAQARLQGTARRGRAAGRTFAAALAAENMLSDGEAHRLTEHPDTGACPEMVDAVLAHASTARAGEPEVWQ
jgi:adenylosuccinate lyase